MAYIRELQISYLCPFCLKLFLKVKKVHSQVMPGHVPHTHVTDQNQRRITLNLLSLLIPATPGRLLAMIRGQDLAVNTGRATIKCDDRL